MTEQIHKLHLMVAKAIEELVSKINPDLSVLKDPACGEGKHLPFFLTDKAHNDTEITNVDLMITYANRTVKLICEIEESDITPIRIFGKFYTAANAEMVKLQNGTEYKMDPKGIFIQILCSAKLPAGTKKLKQGINVSDAINKHLCSDNFWIKEYHLIYGEAGDFEKGKHGYIKIEKILMYLK